MKMPENKVLTNKKAFEQNKDLFKKVAIEKKRLRQSIRDQCRPSKG